MCQERLLVRLVAPVQLLVPLVAPVQMLEAWWALELLLAAL
jgi:hypothetical protein